MTITVVRPNSTVTEIQMTKVPNVTAHTNLDDSPVDDATYVIGLNHGSGLIMGLADVTVPATDRVKRVRTRIRFKHDVLDIGHLHYVDIRLKDPTTNKFSAIETPGTYSNVYTEWTGKWVNAAPGNVAWSETIVDRLQSNIAWRASPAGKFAFVSELYVDVDMNTRPVAGTVTVTGASATTRPTVSWDPSDADGDLLTRWQVRVIEQSLTGLPGFDPLTASAAWTSGGQTGSDKSVVIGTDLLNGTAYVAYAWVAQDWSAPGETLWLSAASASAPFTITLFPPGAPILTATAETQLPDFRVRLGVEDTGNMLTAEDSENETTAGTWAGRSNSTAARTTAQFVNGVGSLQQTATAAADAIAGTAIGVAGYVVTPGVTYSAGFRIRTAVTARSIRAQIEWFTVAGTSISVSEGVSVTDATNWTSPGCVVVATAPATARFAAVRWRVLAAAAAEVHYRDAAWFRRGTYTAANGYAVSGQTSATLRVEKCELVDFTLPGTPQNLTAQQIYSPGSTEGDTSGFGNSEASDSIAIETMDRPWPDLSGSGAGSTMLHWKVRSGTFGLLNVSIATALSDLTLNRFRLPVVAGQPSVGWGYWWSTVQSFAGQWFINWIDDAGGLVGSATAGGVITVTSTPTLFSVTGTPPAGATGAWIQFQNSFSSGYDEVYGVAFGWAMGSTVPLKPGPGVLQPQVFDPIRTDALSTPLGQQLNFYDHELAGGQLAQYRARAEVVISGQSVASLWSPVVTVAMPVPGKTLLKNPLRPDQAIVLMRAPEIDESQSESAWVGQPHGGDRPIKIRDFIGGWDGKLVLAYEDYVDERNLKALLKEAGTVLLQWFDGGQKYLAITSRSGGNIRSGWGRLSVDYIESGRP